MAHNKPVRPQDDLGLDVKLSRADLENDLWAQNTLKEIGRSITKAAGPAHEYLGSLAIHICRTPGNVISTDPVASAGGYEVANIMQWATGDINRKLLQMTLANVMIELKRQFNEPQKTRDPNDKR